MQCTFMFIIKISNICKNLATSLLYGEISSFWLFFINLFCINQWSSVVAYI